MADTLEPREPAALGLEGGALSQPVTVSVRDVVAPTVLSVVPADGATNVDTAATVVITSPVCGSTSTVASSLERRYAIVAPSGPTTMADCGPGITGRGVRRGGLKAISAGCTVRRKTQAPRFIRPSCSAPISPRV